MALIKLTKGGKADDKADHVFVETNSEPERLWREKGYSEPVEDPVAKSKPTARSAGLSRRDYVKK